MKSHTRNFEVPQQDWNSLLRRFTERNSGLQVELETHDRETEEQVTSPAAALQSLTLDLEDEKNPRINVTVLSGNKEIRHILFQPSQVIVHASTKNGVEALTITSVNTETTVRLRRRPSEVFMDRVA